MPGTDFPQLLGKNLFAWDYHSLWFSGKTPGKATRIARKHRRQLFQQGHLTQLELAWTGRWRKTRRAKSGSKALIRL